jgi:hypothetical protein
LNALLLKTTEEISYNVHRQIGGKHPDLLVLTSHLFNASVNIDPLAGKRTKEQI